MNLLVFKSAPIASLVIPIRRRPGAAHPTGAVTAWTTGGHGDFVSRGMRAAQGKIVVPAGCAAQARGGPAVCAGPPRRSQDSHNKAAMGRNCGRCLHGGYGQRHDDTAVRCAMAWPCPVFRPKSAQDACAAWWAPSLRPGGRSSPVPIAQRRFTAPSTPLHQLRARMAGTQPAWSHSGVVAARTAGWPGVPTARAACLSVVRSASSLAVQRRILAASMQMRPCRCTAAPAFPGTAGRGLHAPRWTGKPPAQKRPPFTTLQGGERRAVPGGPAAGCR